MTSPLRSAHLSLIWYASSKPRHGRLLQPRAMPRPAGSHMPVHKTLAGRVQMRCSKWRSFATLHAKYPHFLTPMFFALALTIVFVAGFVHVNALLPQDSGAHAALSRKASFVKPALTSVARQAPLHLSVAAPLTGGTKRHGPASVKTEPLSRRNSMAKGSASKMQVMQGQPERKSAEAKTDQDLKSVHRRLNTTLTRFGTLVSADGTTFRIGADGLDFHVADKEEAPAHVLRDALDGNKGPDANVAFFIQTSDTNIEMLPRLLAILWHPLNSYVIHLDAKIPVHQAAKIIKSVSRDQKLSNIHFLEREPITYQGVSMLLNTLAAIEFLLSNQHDWDYFINISASDYPLVNSAVMRRLLGQPEAAGRETSFLQLSTSKAFWEKMRKYRFKFVFSDTAVGMKEMNHELRSTWVRQPLLDDVGLEFVHSEAWIIAHRSFAEYSVRSSTARKLLILLSGMQDPEEHYFAMLAWNSQKFNRTLAHNALRDIVWDFNGKKSGQHPYYVDEKSPDGSFPLWDRHMSKSRSFFARKFRDPRSPILDRIDRLMSGTSSAPDVRSVTRSITAVRHLFTCITHADRLTGHMPPFLSCAKL